MSAPSKLHTTFSEWSAGRAFRGADAFDVSQDAWEAGFRAGVAYSVTQFPKIIEAEFSKNFSKLAKELIARPDKKETCGLILELGSPCELSRGHQGPCGIGGP